ncbi:hypothetical protein ID866_10981, partial [Astraeus odoratus]
AECIRFCTDLLEQYKRREFTKPEILLKLRDALVESPSVRAGAGRSLSDALGVYLRVLEEIDTLDQQFESGGNSERRGWQPAEADENGSSSSSESSQSDDEADRPSKRAKLQMDNENFPWNKHRTERVVSLPEDIQTTFEQIRLYSSDPKTVVDSILSTPGCPVFPPSQWINLIQWKYVDLTKVLESAHTTEIDPKQTHIIDEKVELSFRVTKPATSIRNATEHNTAFSMLIKALTFVFPQRWEEYSEYQTALG